MRLLFLFCYMEGFGNGHKMRSGLRDHVSDDDVEAEKEPGNSSLVRRTQSLGLEETRFSQDSLQTP